MMRWGKIFRMLPLFAVALQAGEATWRVLSGEQGGLPALGNGKIQTAVAAGDFAKNGTNGFVLGFSDAAPALVLVVNKTNWTATPIELESLSIAPGGFAMDLDGDDDLDLIFGTASGDIYWWENPYPAYDPGKSWPRHPIRKGNGGPIWGELIGDFFGNGEPHLVFWDQFDSTLYAAAVPKEVRTNTAWSVSEIFSRRDATFQSFMPLGLSATDVNIDGQIDLVAGNFWLKLLEHGKFQATPVDDRGGVIFSGRFNEGTYPQFVSNGGKRLAWFDCRINPDKSNSWGSHELLSEQIGTIVVADFNRDGRDDIFAATSGILKPPGDSRNQPPKTWILYGDGKGNFRTTLLRDSNEWQTVSAMDLDRDGALDLVLFTGGANPHLEIWMNESVPQSRPPAPLKAP